MAVNPAKAGIHLVCFKLSCLGAGDKPPRYSRFRRRSCIDFKCLIQRMRHHLLVRRHPAAAGFLQGVA